MKTKTKVCPKCGKRKDLTLFGNDKRAKGGKSSQCKECMNYDKRVRYNLRKLANEDTEGATFTRLLDSKRDSQLTRSLKLKSIHAPSLPVSMVTKEALRKIPGLINQSKTKGRDNREFIIQNKGEDADWLGLMVVLKKELKLVYDLDFQICHLIPVCMDGSFHISNLRLLPAKVNFWIYTDHYTDEEIDAVIARNSEDPKWQGYSWVKSLPIQDFLLLFEEVAPSLPRVIS